MIAIFRLVGRLHPAQFAAYWAGCVLLASGIVHSLVWLVEGGSLAGPVSLRKPILFGISAGLTVISMGWLIGKMRRRMFDLPLMILFSLAMLAEVGLITLQQWRGVPSHFNRSTQVDAIMSTCIEGLIVVATLVIVELTRRSFGPLRVASDMRLAVRGGMGLLLFSCLLGFVLAAYGNYQTSLGNRPDIFGSAGVMKFPHGIPMHAIQILPMLAWFLRNVDVDERERLRSLVYACGAMITFTSYSLLQTFDGRARFDMTVSTTGIMLLTLYLVGMALKPVIYAIRSRLLSARTNDSAERACEILQHGKTNHGREDNSACRNAT